METYYVILLIILTAIIVAIIMYCIMKVRCKNCSVNEKEAIETYINSRHTISMSDTKSLYENYRDRFKGPIATIQTEAVERDGEGEYLPTEYSIVPIIKIKAYLSFLDSLQKKNPSYKISGIAINLGAYSIDKSVENDRSSENDILDPIRMGDYKGRITTFLTPTYYNEDDTVSIYGVERHIPFYIKYDNEKDKFKGTYMPLKDYFEPESGKNDQQFYNKSAVIEDPIVTGDEGAQSAASNEFTDMPPKKPNN